ncbi:hypothetical protein PFISCL1PPCAC_24465, partial [Pristionchus fissidentatus]
FSVVFSLLSPLYGPYSESSSLVIVVLHHTPHHTMDKATIEQELAALGKFKMGQVIGDKWKILQKLDEGGFGTVYKVQHVKDATQLAALKVERANADEMNYLKVETNVLKELHATGIRAHVPQLYRSAKRKHYCYMIITLLGENLRRLKDKHFPKGMPLRTWSRVGIQCLYGIKTMHDRGYVHRDIKAQNFVLGFHATPAFARVVYIIDFGMARAYAYPPSKNGKWIARKARARLEFRGTWRYASPSMHEEKEQGRKDDLWSWLYMMMDLYCGLPWLETDTKDTIELKKLNMRDEDLMIRMPEETKFIPKHLHQLDMYQRPEYWKIWKALDALRKKYKTTYEDSYEWESKEAVIANTKAMRDKTAPIGYADADAFFKSDPIKIMRAPSTGEEKEIIDRFTVKDKKPELIQIEDVIAACNMISPAPSPDKKTTPTVGTPVRSPAKTISGSKEGTKKIRTRSPSKHGRPVSKMSKKSRASKREGSSEDSIDFVPSCYMDVGVPLNYIPTHGSSKDFQKKVVGMDWGHAEPQKQWKDAVSPLPKSQHPQLVQQMLQKSNPSTSQPSSRGLSQQEPSSGPNS